MKYKFDKKNAFNLVEILLTLTLIGIMAVGFLPILSKRTHKSNNPDCLNGYREVRQEFSANAIFTVPKNIAGDITFILVGGGSSGEAGHIVESRENVVLDFNGEIDESDSAGLIICSLPNFKTDESNYYTNLSLDIVRNGKSANCSGSSPSAGSSGAFGTDIPIKVKEKGNNNALECYRLAKNSSNINCINAFGATPKKLNLIVNSGIGYNGTGAKPQRLEGGVPGVKIIKNGKIAGMGESCILSADGATYTGSVSQTDGACRVRYNIAKSGQGGASGAYAKFSLNLVRDTNCVIQVGKGGAPGSSGEVTSVTCGINNPYTTASENNNLPNGGTYVSSQSGNSASTTTISGGASGNVLSEQSSIFSKGGIGGCNGMSSSFDCSSTRGSDGKNGSGGGGGSCNELGCGAGGCGGDGVVIVEYKVQCE